MRIPALRWMSIHQPITVIPFPIYEELYHCSKRIAHPAVLFRGPAHMIKQFIQRTWRIQALRWMSIHQPITVIPFPIMTSCVIVAHPTWPFTGPAHMIRKFIQKGLGDSGTSMADNSATNHYHCHSISYCEELYHCSKRIAHPPGLSEGLLI